MSNNAITTLNTNALLPLLRTELTTRYSLTPTDPWLHTFLSTITRPPPLPALTSTAHFRLTTTDFRTSLLARAPCIFPAGLGDVNVKSVALTCDVPVQVVEVLDVGGSRYSQVEGIERVERGEEVRGREVIRSVRVGEEGPNDNGSGTGSSGSGSGATKKGSTGPHKLLLQDAAGTNTWAFELSRIEKITIVNSAPVLSTVVSTITGSGTAATSRQQLHRAPQQPVEGIQIGCKLILKSGTVVRRGVIMLTPGTTTFLGGRVEGWDRKWREGRKDALKALMEGRDGT